MRLLEFQAPNIMMRDLIAGLSKAMPLERVGGNSRVYQIAGTDLWGVVYVIGDTTKAIGIGWDKSYKNIETIYVWNNFDPDNAPDMAVDIPADATLQSIMEPLVNFIKNPHEGLVENLMEMATQTTEEDFKRMVQNTLGADARKVTLTQLMNIARDNDVRIPGAIRNNPIYKLDPHHWNLSTEDPETVKRDMERAAGAPIESPPPASADPDVDALRQTTALKGLANKGRLTLLGRKANGAFFKMPDSVSEILARLERILSNQIDSGSDRMSMEEQYENLQEQVSLIAGGRSQFIKSLLITGAPSSGKTYTVMKTVKELGLQEGTDYIVKKGHITAASLLRVLIEQIDGLLIFDDCDSVVDEAKAINMLKGALDTDPIREVSYDVKGAINTAVLPFAKRVEYVDSVSRILRGVGTADDVEMHRNLLNKPKNKDKEDADDVDINWLDSDDHKTAVGEELYELEQIFSRRLPNKIDYRGRIIFISNHERDWWDDAIISRAFNVDMNFSDAEMLDFIRKIKTHIPANISEEQKDEVLDYIEELWQSGSLKRPINFRLVQSAFDLRLTTSWKKIIANF